MKKATKVTVFIFLVGVWRTQTTFYVSYRGYILLGDLLNYTWKQLIFLLYFGKLESYLIKIRNLVPCGQFRLFIF